jgi:glutathione S-transferase
MPSITLYGGRMGSSMRAHWMLAELGLSYETKELDMATGAHRSPEFLAINPAGQIPVMLHDDFLLTESAAIVHFLAEKYDLKFLGEATPESHATQLRWELFTLLNIDKNFVTLCYKKWGMPSNAEREEAAREALGKYLPIFEAQMDGMEYIMGNTFTIADIIARSTYNYAEVAEVNLSPYPSIMAWMKRCADRPAYSKAKKA